MRRMVRLWMLVLGWVVGCSGASSGCGCGGMAPIPGGYAGVKNENAINAQMTAEGLQYINQNWKSLVQLIAPNGVIRIPLKCGTTDVPVIGQVVYGDQGQSANNSNVGRLDGACNGSDLPVQVAVRITDLKLSLAQPGNVNAHVSVNIDTGPILISTRNKNNPACFFISAAKCNARFNSARREPLNQSIQAKLSFAIDQKWEKRLTFNIETPLTGTQLCGSGIPGPPLCLDVADVEVDGENTCGDVLCGIADWRPLKELVLKLVAPTIQKEIEKAISKTECQTCDAMNKCPTFGSAVSTCQAGVCMDSATQKCVPPILGLEGRLKLAELLGGLGLSDSSSVDLSVMAGSTFSIDSMGGLNLGVRGGLHAPVVAPCVPPSAAPTFAPLEPPNFRGEAPQISAVGAPYHFALGISSPFMNGALHNAHQGGALCVYLSTSTIGFLNTGLFRTFLGSLGALSARDGKDAPMMIALRPQKPPKLKVGEGGKNPLLTVSLDDLSIDFYAGIDERQVRLFTLTADILLPLSLNFPCGKVEPAIGNIKDVVRNIRTTNSELLAEDPKALADLIPAVLGLVEPELMKAFNNIKLPDVGGFRLQVNGAKGLGKTSGGDYNHLGLYATLLPADVACTAPAPQMIAQFSRGVIPTAAQMSAPSDGLPWPSAILDVSASGMSGTPEYQVRVDDGFWSEFVRADAKGQLEVRKAIFLLQGKHHIEVRARMAEEPQGVSASMTVPFAVDWEAPTIRFEQDSEHDQLLVHARDLVTPDQKLQFSYRMGNGSFSEFGPPLKIDLSVAEWKGFAVRVRDEAGNIGEKAFSGSTEGVRGPSNDSGPGEHASCQSVGGSSMLLALVGLFLSRRRRFLSR